jgi:xyloglucan-specific exo-beta-1,4-glucanase
MRERVIGFAWVLAIAACGEPPREDGPSPFGEADTDPSDGGTTSGDGTTEAPLPEVTTSPSGSGPDPVTSSSAGSEDSGTTAAVDPDSGSSGGESGTSGASSSSSGGFDTTNDGTLMVEVSVQSMWPTGECDDVTVTNVSDEVVVWEVELELPGTITMAWNTTWSEMAGTGTFAGVDFNASLDPGAAAMFGFCVEY